MKNCVIQNVFYIEVCWQVQMVKGLSQSDFLFVETLKLRTIGSSIDQVLSSVPSGGNFTSGGVLL